MDAERGVYYRDEDYAGLSRRLGVIAVDLSLLAVILIVITLADPSWDAPSPTALGIVTLIAWGYLAGLKATRSGTLGYRVFGVRLVDLQGKTPSLWMTTQRFLWLTVGPINFVFDLIWLANDVNHQTLRDKVTETYVVRADAEPIGTGPIAYNVYFVHYMCFTFAEVSRARSV